jgi:N-methylhydantoinase A
LSAGNFLGGQMRLDLARARQAVMKVAAPLRIDPVAAAEGIVRVIEVKMEEAIKAISTMRGHDLRDFMLLAFGGAGPVHAARIARDLGMAGLIVPLYPGVYSAIGLIMSDVKHDYVRSRMQPMSELSVADVNGMFGPLGAQAIADLVRDGFAPEHIDVQRALDLRYAGQGYEITMPCAASALQNGGLPALRSQFDQQHQSMFGHMAPEQPVEVVSYRVRGLGRVPPVELPRFKPTGATLANARRETRRVRLDGRDIDCPVYQRERLDVGMAVVGPAICDQFDCTTVIHAGQTARVDEWKNLIVTQET